MLSAVAGVASAQSIQCHVSFAGATRTFTIAPVSQTDSVTPLLQSIMYKYFERQESCPRLKPGSYRYGMSTVEPMVWRASRLRWAACTCSNG